MTDVRNRMREDWLRAFNWWKANCPALGNTTFEDVVTGLSTYATEQSAEAVKAEREENAQVAFDQQSDNPQPGNWNEACVEIRNLIRSREPKDPPPRAKDDGWIEWWGGERPVGENDRVDVKFRNGTVYTDNAAFSWEWGWSSHRAAPPCARDIIAYRLLPTPEPKADWRDEIERERMALLSENFEHLKACVSEGRFTQALAAAGRIGSLVAAMRLAKERTAHQLTEERSP